MCTRVAVPSKRVLIGALARAFEARMPRIWVGGVGLHTWGNVAAITWLRAGLGFVGLARGWSKAR